MTVLSPAPNKDRNSEPLLSVQLLELLHRHHALAGERLLAFTVLRDALNRYLRPSDSGERGQTHFRDAEAWINRKGERSFFSFDHVCETLDIEPDYLRDGLHRCKAYNCQPTLGAAVQARSFPRSS